MTGAQLAEALRALIRRNPGLSSSRIGTIIRNKRNGIDDIALTIKPKPETIAKVMALIANPPPQAYLGYRKPRTPSSLEAHERRKAGIRRSISRKAHALIAGDGSIKTSGGRINHSIAAAMVRIRVTLESERRASDPVEIALLKIRRSRRVVYRASVHGGPQDRFYISGKGKETIGVRELLKIAGGVGA